MNLKTRSIIFALAVTSSMTSSLVLAQRMPQDSWYLGHEFRGDIEGGKFYHPMDAALGPDGNLYVSDRYNHQVQVFTTNGIFIRKWGNYGTQAGKFNEAGGIHVDASNNVYVCDINNHRLQIFDASGRVIRVIGQYGANDGQLNLPHGVTVDSDGNIFVAEFNGARVSVFRSDGSYLRQWGSSGTGVGQFQGLIGITLVASNRIATVERDGARRVQVFERDGAHAFTFNTTCGLPHGIESDSAGNIYVSGRDWCGVRIFNPTGGYVRVVGQNGAGSGNGQFNPFGFAVGGGRIFACDWNNHRLAIFDTNGTWITNAGSYAKAEFDDTHGIAVAGDGSIFISDYQKHEIRKFDRDYKFVKRFGTYGSGDGQFNGPLMIAISPDQRLYVVEHIANRIHILDLDGNFIGKFGSTGSGNGNFNRPWGIAASSNSVYVADQDNHRVQVFDLDGNFLFKFGQQGSFDGYFQSPHGVAISPEGYVAVADANNRRIQVFDASGAFFRKFNWSTLTSSSRRPYRLSYLADSVLCVSGVDYPDRIRLFSGDGILLKDWSATWASLAETKSGDLIAAHGDRVIRVWKRTYRTVHPPQANALPLPMLISQARRPGTGYVDIEYRVKDDDNVTVDTAMLAFKNGGNSLSDLILMRSFAEGTEANLGPNTAANQIKKVTWDVQQDWNTDFGEVQFEVLAKDSRDLLNLDFIQIPAVGTNEALKISRTPLNDSDFLSVWYWWLAKGDPAIELQSGFLVPAEADVVQTNGLLARYFQNSNFTGQLFDRFDSEPYIPNQTSGNSLGVPFVFYSVIWEGMLLPPLSGRYQFRLTVDDYVSMWIGGQQVVTANNPNAFELDLIEGQAVPIRIDYDDRFGGRHEFRLEWAPPGQAWRRVDSSQLYFSGSVSTPLATVNATTQEGREYIFNRLGLREATADEILRAKEAGTPGVINQWTPKLQVGPAERPVAVNAYGFDTGGTGYWVVPLEDQGN